MTIFIVDWVGDLIGYLLAVWLAYENPLEQIKLDVLELVEALGTWFSDNLGQVYLDPDLLVPIQMYMSWLAWAHDGSIFPVWFALSVDAMFLAIGVSVVIGFLRLLRDVWEAIPLLN